ncbi:MAG: ATPase [Spirochaetales bacterium]|nr:ATPase [Spirochaetales bacterium]
MDDTKKTISSGGTIVGIEFGSTKIKAILIDNSFTPIASGGYNWENTLADGIWTYSLEEVERGLQGAFYDLKQQVLKNYGIQLKKIKAMGISGMMHGYLVFDQEGELLVPFRTWRNNITGEASEELTNLLNYPIPQRWSIAHLYQAILNGEEHINRISYMTTLAGYVHWKLTGQRVLGVGEASGMFPIDSSKINYKVELIDKFDKLIFGYNTGWQLRDILPEVLNAGEPAGELTAEGAAWLDPAGDLQPGIKLCPPEGDAGTGMVATNSVAVRTGNVSAGTSVFAMIVLEKEFSRVHNEIDLVTTPDGHLVAMAHSNNCTSDFNAWVSLLAESAQLLGANFNTDKLYEKMMNQALEGDSDCGGLLSIGYLSGEHITGFTEGRPLFVRGENSNFTLGNFLRCHLFSAICALKAGVDILVEREGVRVDEIKGHGGFFKTPDVGQKIMAAALGTPVSVLDTAGEGGAWGIALLAAYMLTGNKTETLSQFLYGVFTGSMGKTVNPDPRDVEGFRAYFEKYKKGLTVEKAAVENL